MIIIFSYVLMDYLQWNNGIYKMNNYFKGSIAKFNINFENARKQTGINMMVTNVK